jgi:hypothetical protein
LDLSPYKSLENDESLGHYPNASRRFGSSLVRGYTIGLILGQLSQRIEAVRRELGPRLLILGHHYQQDEVIAHSDLRGDSYQLSELAAASTDCRFIAFCGVHFMAETADILANRPEKLANAMASE